MGCRSCSTSTWRAGRSRPASGFPTGSAGTSGWMAPEHRAALDAVAGGQPVPAPVDHRADIYALGLLLREALGGSGSGSGPQGRTSLRRRNPGVSVGLADIIARCLADWPADRYPNAAALADDLRRHLEHQPLRGVANRSPVERWRKWRRRDEPWGPARWAKWISTACVAVVVAGGYGWIAHLRDEGHTDLRDARLYCASGRYADAEVALRRGLDRTAWFPVADSLAADLKTQLRVARRGAWPRHCTTSPSGSASATGSIRPPAPRPRRCSETCAPSGTIAICSSTATLPRSAHGSRIRSGPT